jgi:hypothetical protein
VLLVVVRTGREGKTDSPRSGRVVGSDPTEDGDHRGGGDHHAAAEAWLASADASVLKPTPDGSLIAREVSSRVNLVANDGPELLHGPEPQRQMRLL